MNKAQTEQWAFEFCFGARFSHPNLSILQYGNRKSNQQWWCLPLCAPDYSPSAIANKKNVWLWRKRTTATPPSVPSPTCASEGISWTLKDSNLLPVPEYYSILNQSEKNTYTQLLLEPQRNSRNTPARPPTQQLPFAGGSAHRVGGFSNPGAQHPESSWATPWPDSLLQHSTVATVLPPPFHSSLSTTEGLYWRLRKFGLHTPELGKWPSK